VPKATDTILYSYSNVDIVGGRAPTVTIILEDVGGAAARSQIEALVRTHAAQSLRTRAQCSGDTVCIKRQEMRRRVCVYIYSLKTRQTHCVLRWQVSL